MANIYNIQCTFEKDTFTMYVIPISPFTREKTIRNADLFHHVISSIPGTIHNGVVRVSKTYRLRIRQISRTGWKLDWIYRYLVLNWSDLVSFLVHIPQRQKSYILLSHKTFPTSMSLGKENCSDYLKCCNHQRHIQLIIDNKDCQSNTEREIFVFDYKLLF